MSTDAFRKCSKCGVTPVEDKTNSFHRFPKPGKTNLLRARAWAKYCWPEKDWLSVPELNRLYQSNKVLCKRHFEDSCFTDSSKKRLSKFSVPGDKQYVVKTMKTLREEMSMMEQSNIATTSTDTTEVLLPQHSAEKYDITEQNIATTSTDTTKVVLPQHSTEKYDITEQIFATTSKSSKDTADLPPFSHVKSQPKVKTEQIFATTSKSSKDTADLPPYSDDKSVPIARAEQSLPIIAPSQVSAGTAAAKSTNLKKIKGLLKSVNVVKIAELTSREQKLYRICSRSLKEISRLRKKLKLTKKSVRVEKICESEGVKKLVNLNMTNSFVLLLQSQLKNCPKKQKGRRYNLEQKIMALTLYKKSPACYRLLRRMFALPCQSTLNKLLNRIPLKTGINPQVFEGLKNMAKTQRDDENICILSFDEMAIRKHLFYNERLDIMEGFQDHANHGRSNQVACNALVFMLAGIRKKWKQPVAFYFSGKSVTSDRITVIIKEVLHECFQTGLNVVATVCDLSRVNIKALETLGSSTERPHFTFEGREIVTLLDTPHLLKCTRNMFMKHNVELTTNIQADGKNVRGLAKWSHIQSFYDLDKSNPNFVFAPALTEQHLCPNTKQKMRVKLAAQVFSHSVAAGLMAKIASNELPAEAHATATFLNKFDELFDALNADSPDRRGGKKLSTNITNRSPHLGFFGQMRKLISEMTFIGSSAPPPSQQGWIRTMNAVERLWKNLKTLNIQSLSTRRLNQDPLENCFGCIRYHCGSNDNPTVGQFIAGIKTAIISNLRHSGSKKNCEDDTATLCNNLKSFLLPPVQEKDTDKTFDDIVIDMAPFVSDATEVVELATPEAQACAYVCGFIFKKLKTGKCADCKIDFLADTSCESIHIFTSLKEYEANTEWLKYSDKKFVECVEICASIINTFLSTEAWKENIKQKILTALYSQIGFDFLINCKQHLELNKNHILTSTFHICVKRFYVLKNREFGEVERNKSMQRKITILKNQ